MTEQMTEQQRVDMDRRALWCRVYAETLRQGTHKNAVQTADAAVEEFDRRFNPAAVRQERGLTARH